ncbi:MAG: hypothetical protein U1E73_04440 [Planctomycetota bacterium]
MHEDEVEVVIAVDVGEQRLAAPAADRQAGGRDVGEDAAAVVEYSRLWP